MQSNGILIATFVATLSLPIAGPAQTAAADAEAQARAAQQNAITDRYLTAVQVAMAGKVDTKNAVVGQEVSVRTLAEVRLADGTVLPKGTRLVGHVTQVKAGGPELGSAMLTLTFDRAEVKAGQSVPVRAVIRAVAPSAAAADARREMMAEPPTVMSTMGPTGNTTGRGSGGGGIPGTTGPTMGGGGGGGAGGAGAGSTVPDGMPGTGGTTGGGMPGGTTGSTGPSVGNSGPIIGPRMGSMGGTSSMPATRKVVEAGDSLSGAPHSTGLPGVLLWATPTASGTLTAMGQNISLDNGMQMTLGVITR
jgi:hypothetical protein